jgi:hypothetical protein
MLLSIAKISYEENHIISIFFNIHTAVLKDLVVKLLTFNVYDNVVAEKSTVWEKWLIYVNNEWQTLTKVKAVTNQPVVLSYGFIQATRIHIMLPWNLKNI